MGAFDEVLRRVRAEFIEMPGLHLTSSQVQRLCGIEQTTCRVALDALVDAQFLRLKADGHYVRATKDPVARPRVVNAPIEPIRSMRNAS